MRLTTDQKLESFVRESNHIEGVFRDPFPAEVSELMSFLTPYSVHHHYETLHPFTDGNGRSGRALWLWGMKRLSESDWQRALDLGFLHTWYYQSLEFGGKDYDF